MDRYCDPWSPVVYEACEAATLTVLALPDRLLQGAEREFSIRPAAGGPTDDSTGEQVHNEGRVAES